MNELECNIEQSTYTCAARGSIVRPARRAVTARATAQRVGACTRAVAPAVVRQALVHIWNA